MVSSTTLLVDIHDIKLIERLNDERTLHCILKTICAHNKFNIISTNIHLSLDNINLQIQTQECIFTIITHPAQHHASFFLHSFNYIESSALFEIYEFLTLAFDAPYKSEYITIANTFAPNSSCDLISDTIPLLQPEPVES